MMSSTSDNTTKRAQLPDLYTDILLNNHIILTDPSSRSYESLQSQLNSVQQHLSDYIIHEETAMETRIRYVYLVCHSALYLCGQIADNKIGLIHRVLNSLSEMYMYS